MSLSSFVTPIVVLGLTVATGFQQRSLFAAWTRSGLAKSAIVLANSRTRWNDRALMPGCCLTAFLIDSPASSTLQTSRMHAAVTLAPALQ
jgi:hypothetical protein